VVIGLEQGADCLHMVQPMPLPLRTPSALASFKSRMVLPLCHQHYQVVHFWKLLHYYNHLTAFSGTTWVSRYQKGKTNLDFTGARDNEWQWHQLGHMQVCTSLQTDNHASTPPLCFYRPDAIPAAQPTASKH